MLSESAMVRDVFQAEHELCVFHSLECRISIHVMWGTGIGGVYKLGETRFLMCG